MPTNATILRNASGWHITWKGLWRVPVSMRWVGNWFAAAGLPWGLPWGMHGAVCASFALVGTAQVCQAQQARSVYPDDSVVAKDALIRVKELHDAGNTGEALRVVQSVLDSDAHKLLASARDRDIFYPVRNHVHELLASMPDLLARYRSDQEPIAAALVARNDLVTLVTVERTMLLTPSGFEAALRLAQLELESARFESARLCLEQLERHPDRTSPEAPNARGAIDAARLAAMVAVYLPREDVTSWAARWAKEAGLAAQDQPKKILPATPALAAAAGRSPLDVSPAPKADAPGMEPLQSASFDASTFGHTSGSTEEDDPDQYSGDTPGERIFPTISGGVVYATDGRMTGAWDSATLSPIWRVEGANARIGPSTLDELLQGGRGGGVGGGFASDVADAASVAVGGGVVIAAAGPPLGDTRAGGAHLHAYDAATGAVLWSIDPTALDQRQLGARDATTVATVRGPAVIEADTAVIAVRKNGGARRITSVYLVGVDLYTGAVRWTRLLGGYGSNPWSRTVSRCEAMLLDKGVVYRSDDMGVNGAYEAATGRPVWVRLSPTRSSFDFSMRGESAPPTHAMHRPVLHNGTLFIVEAPITGGPGVGAGRLIQLAASDGSLLGTRDGNVMSGPTYLIKVGDYLAGVGDSRVAWVKINEFDKGTVHLGPAYGRSISGRVIATGAGTLLVPLHDSVGIINPAQPESGGGGGGGGDTRRPYATPGNIIISTAADGVSEHMIVADGSALHTYLSWPDAQSLLNRRVAASPGDATPLLTYIDLVQRGGKPELIPGLADKTLAAIDRNPTTTKALADRSRLFDMLLDIVVQSRRAWATMVELKSEPKADGAEEAPVDAKRVMSRTAPVRDLGLLDEVCERLVRAGEGPGQTVAAVFEKAWLRTTQKRLPDAVECLQQILLDPSLGEVVVGNDLKDAKAEASLPSAAGPAWQRARERLVALLGEHGPAPYAAFDDEAARAIEAVAPLSPPDAYENLARRYPVALLTPELWRKAGEAHASAGNAALAKLAYGSGLAAAELNATIGRPAQTQVIARLAGELVQLATAPSDAEPMYRLLTRLAGDYPSLLITMKEGSVSPQQLADRLRTSLAARTALPRIGAAFSPQGVQALAAWEPLTPLCRLTAGSAQGAVIMLNETLNQVGLWATDAEDGALKLAWVRRYDAKPTVVRVTPDATCLFWPTSSGGYLESIINVGGKARVGAVAWKTQEFASLFPPPELNEGVGGGGFATPIDAKEVRPDDILILANAFEVVIVQRRGRAAVFAGETGKVVWSKQLDMSRVFEAELSKTHLVVGGTFLNKAEGRYRPLVTSHKLATGEDASRLNHNQLGDHPRWIRATEEGDVLVASSKGLTRFDPASGGVRWAVQGEPAQHSIGAWIVGSAVFVLGGNEPTLWRMSLADGSAAAHEVDLRERVRFPLTAQVQGRTVTITSPTGLVVVNEAGETIGGDAINGQPSLEAIQSGERVIVGLEAELRLNEEPQEEPGLRLFAFAHPSGKLLNIQRVKVYDTAGSLTLLDGKVIIVAGPVTLVIDAPDEPAKRK